MTRIGQKHIVAFMVLTIVVATSSMSQEANISLQERLTSLAEVVKLPGYSALKMVKGTELQQFFGGVRESGRTSPITMSTVQVHGSLNSILVAVSVMKAIEQGHFNLDTPINDILPFQVVHPNDRDVAITVKQLLGHKGGLKDEAGMMYRSYLFTRDINFNHEALDSDEKKMLRRANLSDRYSLQALLQKSLTLKGEFYSKNTFSNNLPGDAAEFTMTGLSLLALVVESATGYFYDQYASEFIFEPLGMQSITWTIPPTGVDAATPHMGSSMDVIPDYNQILYPSTGFRASTDDVKILLTEILDGLAGDGKLLTPESWKMIFGGLIPKFQNHTTTEMNPAPIEALSSYNLAGYHVFGSQNYGSTSVLLIEPQKGEVIYFTSNTCFAHLNRGGYFLSEFMRLLIEPYE